MKGGQDRELIRLGRLGAVHARRDELLRLQQAPLTKRIAEAIDAEGVASLPIDLDLGVARHLRVRIRRDCQGQRCTGGHQPAS